MHGKSVKICQREFENLVENSDYEDGKKWIFVIQNLNKCKFLIKKISETSEWCQLQVCPDLNLEQNHFRTHFSLILEEIVLIANL